MPTSSELPPPAGPVPGTAAVAGQVQTSDALTDDEFRGVRALLDEVEELDGAPPLSDAATLRLGQAARATVHVLTGSRGHGTAPTGYAQATRSQDTVSIELAVSARGDRDRISADLLQAALSAVPARRALVWSHGQRSPVAAALTAAGFTAVRTLLKLARPLPDPPETTAEPQGVLIRTFRAGVDDAAVLRVNARAFSHHPEQGSWTAADLGARIAEPWYDADGFLLAVDTSAGASPEDAALLGFHWTKLHPIRGQRPLGEVYVLAVDPAAQGRRLAGLLLRRGLAALHARGARTVFLYTEADNHAALRVYHRTGFEVIDTDTQYERTSTD